MYKVSIPCKLNNVTLSTVNIIHNLGYFIGFQSSFNVINRYVNTTFVSFKQFDLWKSYTSFE